jgi:dethiobiotin synthetase
MTRTRYPRGFFVTGTDTGVGKTRFAVALLEALTRAGARTAGMKPVASGCETRGGRLVNDDALALKAASSIDAPYDQVNPYAFAPAIAPHVAAARAGVSIELSRLRSCFDALALRADSVVVEGAGGWLVPLGPDTTMADLAASLRLPIVLVVGMRLGCISHALLTARAIEASGQRLAGWVANDPQPPMPERAASVAAIAERLDAPCIADLGHDEEPNLESIASHCLAISF